MCLYIYSSLCKSLMLSPITLIKKNIKITVFLSLNRNNKGGGKSSVNYSFILGFPNLITTSNKNSQER